MTRVDGYGRIDRATDIRFTFDDVEYVGHPGDTLASALLANGVRHIGTSVKMGRPRGIGAAWVEDPTGVVQIEKPFTEPMLSAATVELTDGLVARSVSGQGVVAQEADPARYDRKYTHTDTLVIGAGIAGLLAARSAARAGENVVLVDDRAAAGGALTGTEQIDGEPALDFVAEVVAELKAAPEVLCLQRTTAFGHYDDGFVLAVEKRTDHLGSSAPSNRARQRVHRIRAVKIVIATGAHERPIVFCDNDRPGIMLAASARDFLHRYGVRVGAEIVVFTSDDSAYAAAFDLAASGARVHALDARDVIAAPLQERAVTAGVQVSLSTVVSGTEGERELEAVLSAGPDGPRRLPADTLLVCGGWNPAAHLFSHIKGKLAYDAEIGSFRPAGSVPGISVIGAANGSFSLAEAVRSGGGAVVEDDPVGTPTKVLWRTEGDAASQFVDTQRDATVEDIARAIGAGMRSVEHIKRYTTIGTAHDQGKTSGVVASGIAAELLGEPIETLGTTTFRPPYTPVAFAALAGRERGALFDPVRTTALHHWHVEANAVFEDVGQWKRARYYPKPDENMETAVLRECAATRSGVGILDGSTLGKIDVQGPDAGEFLDFLYTNMMSTLKVGRVRYGVMCGNDGMVLDDGTVLRLAENHFLLTTTTGGAAAILEWMEEWLQTEWPQLRVYLTSVTEHWAVFPVVGPRSRDVIGEVFPDVDVANDAFPFMSFQDTEINGVPVRLARISFSGELAWEVNVSAWYAPTLWQKLLRAGEKYGITPYGTETMHVLRAEKGYPIIGQDTDGTVTPQDLGMSWAVSKKKRDFIGKRSFSRQENNNPLRKQLVSLLPKDCATVLPEGAQIVEHCADGVLPPAPVPMLGHVTSSYRSAELGRPFALALVKAGRERIGDVVHVPVDDRLVEVEIGNTVVVDPEGARRDG